MNWSQLSSYYLNVNFLPPYHTETKGPVNSGVEFKEIERVEIQLDSALYSASPFHKGIHNQISTIHEDIEHRTPARAPCGTGAGAYLKKLVQSQLMMLSVIE